MLERLSASINNNRPSETGNHAACYKHPTNKDKVLLVTNCPVRAVLADRSTIRSEFFPQNIKRVGTHKGVAVYEMDKYTEPLRLSQLSKLDKKISNTLYRARSLSSLYESTLPERLKRDIRAIIAAIRRAGYRPVLDACEDNMMITKNKRLVLNDIFWVEHAQYETQDNQGV